MFENAVKLEDTINEIILGNRPLDTEQNQLDNIS
jgi:hypothetical protein